jgi:Zn-finger nucleic acid-binding protein
MCGAAASADATRCDHCGARLATVSCPSCFGVMFSGQKFCPHCGGKADRHEESAPSKPQLCPRCKTPMEAVVVGEAKLCECPHCEGLWTDAEALRQICASQEKQSAILGMASRLPPADGLELEKQIRYLPCPTCGQLMNRVNFANCSNVIVDVCRQDGTWFDRDELRRVVEFIRDGGLDKSRAREKANLEEQRRSAALDRLGPASIDSPDIGDCVRHEAIFEIAQGVINLFQR